MPQQQQHAYCGSAAKALAAGIMTREHIAFLGDEADKLAWFAMRSILWKQLVRAETRQDVTNVERASAENGKPATEWTGGTLEFHESLRGLANHTDASYVRWARMRMDEMVEKLKREEIHLDTACDILLGKQPGGLPAAQADQELLEQVQRLDESVVKTVEDKIICLSLPKRGTSPEALREAAKQLRWLAGHLQRQAKIAESRAQYYADHLGDFETDCDA